MTENISNTGINSVNEAYRNRTKIAILQDVTICRKLNRKIRKKYAN